MTQDLTYPCALTELTPARRKVERMVRVLDWVVSYANEIVG